MASDATPVQIPAMSLVHGSQAPTKITGPLPGGNSLPPGGNDAGEAAKSVAKSVAIPRTTEEQVAFLNKYLNESGRPDQFRLAPNSNSSMIQEVNPSNGEVIGEYPAISFPALAKSLGISGALIDEHV